MKFQHKNPLYTLHSTLLTLRKGFTMIELLVVIAILGILVAVGVASFSTAQKTTRDSRRKQDMKAISSALELYYAQANGYPDTMTPVSNITYFQDGKIPKDPKNSGLNVYTLTSTAADGYCVCAKLENANAGNSSANNCTIVDSGEYYCIQEAQ